MKPRKLRPTTAPGPNEGGPFYKRAFAITTKELRALQTKRQQLLF